MLPEEIVTFSWQGQTSAPKIEVHLNVCSKNKVSYVDTYTAPTKNHMQVNLKLGANVEIVV